MMITKVLSHIALEVLANAMVWEDVDSNAAVEVCPVSRGQTVGGGSIAWLDQECIDL
jgi:hypothetical protein